MSLTDADQVVRYKGFDVEIQDSSGSPTSTDSDWVTISGGELEDKSKNGSTSRRIIREVTLRGPLTPGRQAMTNWLNDTLNGGERYRTVTIALNPVDPNKQRREILIFEDAYITGYVFPPLDLSDPCPPTLIEELRLTYGRLLRLPG